MTPRKRKALKKAFQENEDSADVFFPKKSDFNYWFTFINSVMFDNCLDKPTRVEIRRLHGRLGEAECDVNTGETCIRLKDRFYAASRADLDASSKQMFINTLAHEMVHLLEMQMIGKMTHGRFYKGWKKTFDRIGIVL